MKSLEFEIPFVSTIFIFILCIMYFKKKRIKLVENNYYNYILIFSFLECLLSTIAHALCSFVPNDIIVKDYYNFLFIINSIVTTLFVGIFLSLFIYVLTISYKKIEANSIKIRHFLFIFMLIFFIIIQFTNIDIQQIGNVTNIGGNMIIISYIFVFIFLLFSVITSIFNLKNINKKYYIVFLILPILGSLYCLTLLFRGIIIYDFALALLCYIMYFTIENPDIIMIKQLEFAKETADKANRAKSDFLSSMSHEIRTPLNAIVGFSECIKQEETLQAAKQDADDIIMASTNLLEIVNSILDISKIESNKMEIIEKDYNLNLELINITKLMKARVGEKPIEIKTNFSSDIPKYLYGDIGKLKQIIINLMTNAVKYTDSGEINFNVNCINEENVSSLVISVEDTGRGIKEENVDKLFSKFNRLEEDKNTAIEGTGLGLAITKSLIDLMGGKIVVQSKYGIGSRFTVYLKQKISEKEEEIQIIQKENTSFSEKNIIVVDDNDLNLKIMDKKLKEFGINVTLLKSGLDCIALLKENKNYDLLFLDDMMPIIKGSETLEKLKEMGDFNIPTVLLTANQVSDLKFDYIKVGFCGYLEKPFQNDALLKILNENLKANDNKVQVESSTNNDNEKEEFIHKDYSGKNILIVDDNNLNIKIASKILSAYKFNIDESLSGMDAIEKVKNKNYDLIFMDIMMPDMDGIETLHKLKENENFNIPVIALTADALEGAKDRYIKEGFINYISKPINKKLLDDIINEILNN